MWKQSVIIFDESMRYCIEHLSLMGAGTCGSIPYPDSGMYFDVLLGEFV